MAWLIAILLIGFLVYAAGKETRFGGLGLLWRSALGVVGLGIIVIIGLWINENHQNAQWRKRQAIEAEMAANKQKIIDQEELQKKERIAAAQATLQAIRDEKQKKREDFQLKWGYSDSTLNQLAGYKFPLSPILDRGMVSVTTLKGETKFAVSTSYCGIKDGKGCSVYGDMSDGSSWLAKNVEDILEDSSGIDSKNLVWLIDSKR